MKRTNKVEGFEHKGHTLEVTTEDDFDGTKKWYSVVIPGREDAYCMFVGYVYDDVTLEDFIKWVDFFVENSYAPRQKVRFDPVD